MPRAIRLKEYPKSTEITNTPADTYVAASDASLAKERYRISTDENGFILPEPGGETGAPSVIFLGDSVIESMYAPPEARLCSRLQDIVGQEHGMKARILNGGYSGATALHSFNTFMNKIIPLRPAAVVLMTGMVDTDVAMVKTSFWSRDCWIEPIVEIDHRNQWRDPDKYAAPSFDDQARLMAMFSMASRTFGIPVWFATVPHRQVYGGAYVETAFKDRADFDRQVSARKMVNDITRRTALKDDVPLFDLEVDLADRADIFHDMFHLNALGGEAVARSLIKFGFAERLAAALGRSIPVQASSGGLPIHVINLDRSADRLESFKRTNAHLRNIVRVRAVDGATLDRETLIKDGIMARDLDYSGGTLGCAMSHIGMWRMAVAEGRAITVAEDDAVFARQFDASSQSLLASLPSDWDVVIWHANPSLFTWIDALPGGIGAKVQFFQGRLFDNLGQFQTVQTDPALVRVRHAYGAIGYSISSKGARALLDLCLPLQTKLIEFPGFGVRTGNDGIDCAMAGIYPALKAFVCIPPMVVSDDRPELSVRRSM